ncbi:PREDICTED: high mobility group B protein 10-like [Ipomoea nil]|uniref:high mobility group B protein 10-like n=1 Tax=Ipomoea nil TaxID=35883 RepID=UPI0009016CD1|nr:PREDICTED: high mobility group B protein 10-like [Ipomoea nil]
MQEYKRRKKALADKNTAALAGAGGADDPKPGPPATVADGNSESTKVAPEAAARSRSDEKDVFYERLQKLNESSGLSLIINLRETTLDLYLLYKEVTIRGGFHQVTKDGKWDEIARFLKRKDNVIIIGTQLKNVYNSILQQFEQMHHYRTPGKASPSSQQGPKVGSADSPNGLRGTKRHYERLLLCSNIQDTPNNKTTFTPDNYQLSKGPKTPELKPILRTSTNDKEVKKARTAYQLYLKLECDRFKNAHGENSVNQKVIDEIIDTWRHLSESERKPYVDASNKDKERYNLQMAAYKEHKSESSNQSLSHISTQSRSLFHISSSQTQSETKSHQSWFSSSAPSVINFGSSSSSSSQTYDDYYVSLQGGDDGNELVPPDKSLVDSTIEMLKGARPGDPIFQVDWDYSF